VDFQALDITLLKKIQASRIEFLDPLFGIITDSAYFTAFLISFGLLVYAYRANNPSLKGKSLKVAVALLVNTVIITILKHTIDRPRPFEVDSTIEKLALGGSPSFPSGHTADAFLILAAIAITYPTKKLLIIVLAFWALLVAYSRMVLGVHYLSDVLASVVLGPINAYIGIAVYERIRKPDVGLPK